MPGLPPAPPARCSKSHLPASRPQPPAAALAPPTPLRSTAQGTFGQLAKAAVSASSRAPETQSPHWVIVAAVYPTGRPSLSLRNNLSGYAVLRGRARHESSTCPSPSRARSDSKLQGLRAILSFFIFLSIKRNLWGVFHRVKTGYLPHSLGGARFGKKVAKVAIAGCTHLLSVAPRRENRSR